MEENKESMPPFFAVFYEVAEIVKQNKQIVQCNNCPYSLLSELSDNQIELCSFTKSIISTLTLLFQGIIERNKGKYQIDLRLIEVLNMFSNDLDVLQKECEGFPV